MKVTIEKKEAMMIIRKHLESIFLNAQVNEALAGYSDFVFEVTDKKPDSAGGEK